MEMQVDELQGGITSVTLNGRFDLKATETVDKRFDVLAGSKKLVLVDLSAVDFLASLGIRVLLTSAKSILRRGGKLVLVAPEGNALMVLTTAGIGNLIPIFADHPTAIAALS